MNLRTQIQLFLQRYQTTGWLILLMGAGFLIEILLILILGAASSREVAFKVIDSLALPTNFMDLVYQPWSIFTYVFFPVLQPFRFFHLIITGFILWAFGRIHQQLLGNERTRRLLILAIPLVALLTISVTSIVGFYYDGQAESPVVQVQEELPKEAPKEVEATESTAPTPDNSSDSQASVTDEEEEPRNGRRIGLKHLAYVSGMMPLVLLMVISCITLVPEYPVQLFLFGTVKIVYIGIILFLLELALALFATPLAISYAFGGLLGFGFIYSLRRGTDITDAVWNYYTSSGKGEKSRKMEVKRGDQVNKKGIKGGSKKPSGDKKGKIPEEIIDNILDKISASGYESLSREEKELLYKASTQKEDEKRD